jgi:hypothetical protein
MIMSSVVKQWLGKHIPAAAHMQATIKDIAGNHGFYKFCAQAI